MSDKTVEEKKLELEKQRFAHEQRMDEVKTELEKLRLNSESRFANRHLATLITGALSFAAVIVSAIVVVSP